MPKDLAPHLGHKTAPPLKSFSFPWGLSLTKKSFFHWGDTSSMCHPLLFPAHKAPYPGQLLLRPQCLSKVCTFKADLPCAAFLERAAYSGNSSAVERCLAKAEAEGSIPFFRPASFLHLRGVKTLYVFSNSSVVEHMAVNH